MGYATAKQVEASAIPVIDVSILRDETPESFARIADALRDAAEQVGFFYIRDHGIDADLISAVFAVAARFYAHDNETKNGVRINANHRGYLRIGEAKMRGGKKADLKESFVWGLDVAADDPAVLAGNPLLGPNQWPDFVPEMRATLSRFMDECNTLGGLLFRALATGLGVPEDSFTRTFDRPISRGAIIHYPPQEANRGLDQFGVGPHTDYGCLTLLAQDSVGGLQVRDRAGDWVTAHPVEGTFVVNIGDLMARWTNDRFASTEHRVVNESGRERFSTAVFVDPNFDTVVAPVGLAGAAPKYPPTTCGDYIVGRLNASMVYRKKAS
jgi:isopenicillin N synthase-like dioxygenase